MKTVLFISSNKVLGQGLSAAIQAKPELDFLWAAQLHYPQAVVGVDIFHADVVILEQDLKILLLVRPEQSAVCSRVIDAKNAGLIDDFVFYDSSLAYLLAKLAAFS